jgi:hypothetical protein
MPVRFARVHTIVRMLRSDNGLPKRLSHNAVVWEWKHTRSVSMYVRTLCTA